MIAIRKGSIYLCSKCNCEVYRANKDLNMGDQITGKEIYNIQLDRDCIGGEIAKCSKCEEDCNHLLNPNFWKMKNMSGEE